MQALNLDLSKYGFVGPDLWKRLTDVMVNHTFARDETILSKGAVNRRVYFIEKGLVKIGGDSNGEDIIAYLLKENDFVIATDSFFCELPTAYEITALEDTMAVSALKAELDAISKDFPELSDIINKIQAKYRKDKDRREDTFKKMSPLERYNWLKEKNPDLIRRLDDRTIYTFLCISRAKYYQFKNGAIREELEKSNSTAILF